MIGRFRLSRIHLNRLAESGVALEDVWKAAGLPPGSLRDERILLDTEQFFAFWNAVAAVSGDPLIGLRLGADARLPSYDPVGLAALSSSTFHDAIVRAGRYKQLTCPEEIRLSRRGRECRVQFRWLLTRDRVPSLLQDLCFAWIVVLGRTGTGHSIAPLRVEFSRPSNQRKAYETHFNCAVRFDAPADSLLFDAADLERPFRTSNGDLLAMIAPQLEAELADREEDTSAAERVKAMVKRMLAGRRPDLTAVSREMGTSTRTLQRRLSAEGITYQQILEDARRELAHHYLLNSTLDLSETAYLLGYEDASSFFRAFHQWEGSPPGQWREGQLRQ